jgi:hypothetical protein
MDNVTPAACDAELKMTLDEFRESLIATEPPAGLTHALADCVRPSQIEQMTVESRARKFMTNGRCHEVELRKRRLVRNDEVRVGESRCLLDKRAGLASQHAVPILPHRHTVRL